MIPVHDADTGQHQARGKASSCSNRILKPPLHQVPSWAVFRERRVDIPSSQRPACELPNLHPSSVRTRTKKKVRNLLTVRLLPGALARTPCGCVVRFHPSEGGKGVAVASVDEVHFFFNLAEKRRRRRSVTTGKPHQYWCASDYEGMLKQLHKKTVGEASKPRSTELWLLHFSTLPPVPPGSVCQSVEKSAPEGYF